MNNEIPEDTITSFKCPLCEDGEVDVETGECDMCEFISYDVDMDSDLWGVII